MRSSHYGIAVIFDVVYNHASRDVKGQPESIYFFDRAAGTNPNDSLYFTDQDHTGPVFAFWKPEVRQSLIDNARFFVDEYHVDGFRYDQVTVIDKQTVGAGWRFCQDLNGTLNAQDASTVNIAEYWGPEPAVVRRQEEKGAVFDANWHDGLRMRFRGVIAQASDGRSAFVHWQPVVNQLRAPGFRDAWRAVQYLESHDDDRLSSLHTRAGVASKEAPGAARRRRVDPLDGKRAEGPCVSAVVRRRRPRRRRCREPERINALRIPDSDALARPVAGSVQPDPSSCICSAMLAPALKRTLHH